MNLDLKKILKTFKLHEDKISMVLGIIILLIAGIFLINYFKNIKSQSQITNTGDSTQTQEITYTVKKGDTLWNIAQKFYGKGQDWKKIADANNISNSRKLEIGKELTIPGVTNSIQTQQNTKINSQTTPKEFPVKPITGANYKVVKGDTLWQISIRAYGDGFKWTKIAKENHLKNPNLIYPGNMLLILR